MIYRINRIESKREERGMWKCVSDWADREIIFALLEVPQFFGH